MRVIVDFGGYEMRNIGDMAMLQVSLSRINQELCNPEVHVFTTQPDRLEKFYPGVIPISTSIIEGRSLWFQAWNVFGGLQKYIPRKFHTHLRLLECSVRNTFPRLVEKWISHRFAKRNIPIDNLHQFFSVMKSSDILIASGGGYVTDSFEGHAATILSTLSFAQALKKPTFMFGQGIGPLRSDFLMGLSRKVLPRLKVLSLRESKSCTPVLKMLDVPDDVTRLTGDDAIQLAYDKRPKFIGGKIGVNLRMASYSDIGSDTLVRFRSALSLVSQRFQASLSPVPISGHDADSDFDTLSKIIDDDNEISSLDTPDKVINQVSACRVVVTGSYHAGVFALSQGVSVVGVVKSTYYKYKFNGLLDQFGDGCYLVNVSADNFEELLIDAMVKAWHSAPDNRNSLLERAEQQIEESIKAYHVLRAYC